VLHRGHGARPLGDDATARGAVVVRAARLPRLDGCDLPLDLGVVRSHGAPLHVDPGKALTRDALDLAHRVRAVAARAHQGGVGATLDAPERAVVGAIEEVLHEPGDGGEVLRGREHVAVRGEHVGDMGLGGAEQPHVDAGFEPRDSRFHWRKHTTAGRRCASRSG